MKSGLLKSVVGRNIVGVLALLIAYYVPDRFAIEDRSGFSKYSPYLLLLTMYGWIVFHNLVLFNRLYLRDKKRAYFLWTFGLMILSSVNMHLVIIKGFGYTDTLSKILSFWIFTITGLGVYVIFKYKDVFLYKPLPPSRRPDDSTDFFNCIIDGIENQIPLKSIVYIESLENYIKIVTQQKKHLVRLPLKEAEQKLPKSFLRVSRSHIVNIQFIERVEAESLKVSDQILKIGKVYKRYVEAELAKAVIGE